MEQVGERASGGASIGSLREGAVAGGLPRVTEGECVTIKLAQTQNYAGSFRHGYAVPPPSRREAFAKPIIPQIGRENNLSAEILLLRTVEDACPYKCCVKRPYEKEPNPRPFCGKRFCMV